MNKVYKTVWNKSLGCWQVTSELTRSHSRGGQSSTVTGHVKETKTWFQTLRLSLLSLALLPISLWAGVSDVQLPTGGSVTVGSAQVSQNNNTLNVHQNSQNVGIQWDTFNIGQNATVNFYQPNTSSIAVNRVLDSNASQIMGKLNANGQVFLLNPNGVIFSKTAQVNVGGIVASTLNVTDSDIISGNFTLKNQSNAASVENYGSVIANGGVVAFIAPTVINEGQIQAHNGVIHLTAADQVTLKLQDGQLTEYKVEIGTLQGLIDNRGAILANNGAIYLTAKAKDSLSKAVVNHSGIIEANRLSQNAKGEIVLLADMQQGTTNVSGILKSEGRNGQAGGFIETSAAQVKIADGTQVSTLSDGGKIGTWLIDPTDFSINAGSAAQTGSGIGATTLQNNLNSTSVILETQNAGSEKGDINVNAAVTWNKDTTLTLKAHNDINVNASITAQNQDGKVVLLYGQNDTESANYYIKNGAKINLKAGQNFSTQKGTDVSKRIDYNVVTDLQALQNINNALAGNYVLGTDIDATVTKDWGVGDEKGFNPLGNEFDYFTGRFDGLGHTVSHLTINRPYSYDVGLFGHIDGAVVRNVGLVGGSVIGDSFVGGLVGQSSHQSLVENVFNTGSVQGYGTVGGLVGGNFDGSTIKNAYATGNVTGAQNSTYIGGLVGGNDGAVIENVYASGNVNGTDIVGGLVGDNNHGGTINNAYATGAVTGEQNVGGLVGNNYYDAEVKNAYATGAVTGTDRVGGLVGENLAANIENTYALGKVTGVTAIGGLLGKNVQGVVTNSYWDKNKTGLDSSSGSANTSGLTSDEMFNANKFIGFDFDEIWANADNQTTPYFKDHIGPNQVVNKQDQLGGYYSVIQNLNQLQNINQNLAGNYLLGNDIDAKNSQFWGDANGIGFNPLGDSSHAFTGKLDGLGHQISDLYIYRETTDNVGLFGYIQNANLKNFGVVNSNIKGQNHVGAVVGNSTQNSQLYSIYSTGSVVGTGDAVGGLVGQQQDGSKIESAYSTSQVTGQNHVGGLVGTNQNAIIKDTYATGAVSGLSNVAGLVGSNQNQATVQNAYATGRVTGNSLIGGLVGNNSNATVSNGHWNKETTLQNDSAGSSASSGLTNAEMKDASKFTFLDADSKLGGKQTAWRIYDGLSVPLLRSFLTTKDLSVTDKTTTYTGKEQHFADVWGLDSSKYTANGQTSGTDAGLYKAIYYSDNQHGYDFIGNEGTLTINKAKVTITGNSDTTTYNGKTQSINNPHYTVDGLVNGEAESLLGNIAITGASGKDAGNYTNKVTGENSSTKNYDITYVDGKFVINKKKATVYALDETREYNGFNQQINSFRADGLVDGETESVLAVNAVATRKDAGNYVHAVAYSNAAKGDKNYDLTFVNGTYTITKATATIKGNSLATTYNGQVQNVAGFTIAGLKGNDANNQANIFSSVTASGASDRNAGSYTNTVAGAASTTNYNIVYENGSLNIAKKQITGVLTAQDKVYDGTTSAIVNGSLNGLITGDQVNLNAQGQFTDKNAGSNKNVNVSGNLTGTDAANYSLQANSQTQASISKKQITGVLTAQDKVYDGTTSAIINGSLNGLITGDQVNLNVEGQFADKNAGSNKNVNVSGNLTGTDAANYDLAANTSAQASISKKQIIGSITAQDKVYDGTTSAIINGSLNGLITGDQVNLNAQGQFTDKNAGSNKNVNVSGNLSGTDASNYDLAANTSAQANISKKQITGVLTAQDKVYDGTTSAIVNGSLNVGGVITGDQVSVGTTGQFVDKNAGQNKVVTASSSLVGLDVGNYELTTNGQVTANISKKQITGSITAQDKVYDGTTSAIVNGSLNGLITGDQVNLNAQGQFADKNAASNKNVNVSGNLSGTDATNYSLQANSQTQASISKKQVTGVLTAQDKVYDGTTSATVNGSLNGLITGDQVNLNAQGQFADKNAGSNKNVNVSGNLTGIDAANYSLQANSQTQANISKKQITGVLTAQDKVYDGTTNAVVNSSLNGLITGDQVNLNAQGQFADKNAGSNKNVNVSGNLTGTDATNYSLQANSQTQANISKKQITGVLTAQDKIYDGTTSSIVNGSLNGLITGDQVNLNAQGQFADKNAGANKNVNVSGNLSGTDAGNYDLVANTSAQANISKKQITGVLTAQDKVYDGTTNANVSGTLNVGGVITGDQVSVGTTGQFVDKNAGQNKVVTASSSLVGLDAGNYELTTNGQVTANISKKQVTGVLTAQDKVYDGTTNATVNGSLNGLITGDQVNLNVEGQFADKNAGSNKNVNVSGSLTGTDAGNYDLAANTSAQANISKKQITGVLTAQDKVYDGTTSAIVNGSLNGLITGDQVNLNAQGQFADKNAGSNKNVNVLGNLSGTDAGNYDLAANTSAQANISKKQITGVLTAQDKVYDGTTSAIVNGSLNASDVITGDQVSVGTTGQFVDKNAGQNKVVTASSSLVGLDAGNYELKTNGQVTANISKKQITGVLTAQDKVYDGTTSAIVNGSLNASDVITGDQVSVGTTGQFVDKNAGQNKVVTASSSLVGLDAGNYELTTNGQVTANISKKQITGVLTAQDKVYDGTTSAIINGSLNGLIAGDQVNLNAQGQFADKNAASNKNVNVSGNLSGTDATNYSLQANSQTQASISKKQITGVLTAQDKVYDGTTSAIVNGSLNASDVITGDQVSVGTTGQFVDKNAGQNKVVTASSSLVGLDAGNYELTTNGQVTANISKKQITGVLTAQDKVYDGTTNAIVNGALNAGGVITGDQVSVGTTGQFVDKNAGQNKVVTASSSLVGLDAGNYELTTNGQVTANISKKQITGVLTAQDKVYDGTTSAIVNGSLNSLITGDQVNLNVQGQFADKNAGSNKNVNVSGSLSGTDAGNYSLQANSQTQANISKKQITGSITAQDKVYDGTTSAIVNGSLNGLITGDQVNLNAQGQFADKNAGANKTVNVSGNLTGTDAANYSLQANSQTQANISKKQITGVLTAQDKVYDGTTNANVSGTLNVGGVITGDQVSVGTTGQFVDKNAGQNKVVTASSSLVGLDAGNYELTTNGQVTANISKKQITGVLTAQDKVYDGTTSAIVNGALNAGGVITGDQVSVGTTGQFVDKNAGQNKVVTASSSLVGLDAGNYELTTNGQVTANISKKQITGALTAQDKVYDGTTSAIVNGSLNGLITGDQVNLNAQGQFADKNAGANKTVNVSGNLTGTDAGNYDLAANTSAQANISKKQITGSITAQDKVYDGTTSATVNGSLNGLITGDQVNLNAQGQFADKNAASNKNVNVSGNLTGTDAGNYDLAANTSAQANISKKQVTGVLTAQDKIYDGTTNAIVNGSLNGLITGDQVNLNAQGQFADKNAGSNKTVNVLGNLTGTDAGNYDLAANTSAQASISKKQITGVLTAQDKVYDGTTSATVNGSLNGLITGDQVNLNVQGQFADKNAASNKNVNVSGSLTGTDAGNYDLAANASAQANISKKQVTGVLTAQDKVYDGTTSAIVNGSLNGLITGDQVNLNAQGQFADKNAASNKNVNVSGNLTGTDAANYSLQANSQTQANISKKQITGSITTQDKVYDGTTSAIVNGSLNGLITGDQVNLNAQGQFADKNAGSNKNVNVSGNLSGTDAGNYDLAANTSAQANISKKQIAGSITAQDKVYDGTTSAIVNGSLNGLITGDQVNLNAQGQFADKNAASNKNVTVSGNLSGTDATNYSLQANSQTQASISKKQITGVLTAQDKVYDGTTSAIVNGSLNGLITGDQVNLNAQGQFADKNAASNKNVNVSGNLTGTDAANYSLQANSQTQANISKKQITGVLTAQDKVYDGTTSAIVNGSLNGLITGDQVNLNAQGQFADKNAASNKNVNVSGNLTGTDAANYSLQANSQTQANISKKQITGVLTAQDKVYDGTTSAIVNGSLNGLITGDQVNLNAQGQFADKNAASNKNVNVSGNLTGTDAANYSLQANSQTQANISKKQITGSITTQDKVYDGTTSAIVNGSLNGLITGDQVNLNAQGQFADKNAGSNKNVNVSGNLSGTDAGNYDLAANTSAQANISKKQIAGSITAQDKVYDGTTSAIVNGSLNGLITGDQVNLNAQGQFADKNAGSNKAVNVSGNLSGTDAGNYDLAANTSAQANISKKQVTGVLTAQDKVYDGTTSAIVNGSLNASDVITGDQVSVGTTGQFVDKNAGQNKVVTASSSLVGLDAGNYELTTNGQVTANISKKQVTGSITAQDKVYDGTTSAIVNGSLNGLITGDQVNLNAQGQFADKNAGLNKNVNVSGNLSGTDAGNYDLAANTSAQANISKKQIAGSITAQDKVYDGTTSAIVNGSLNGLITGDQVNLNAQGQFADKNAGSNKNVTVSGNLSGTDADNYDLAANTSAQANISKKQITGVLTAQDKVYDGTTSAIVNGSLNANDVITGDQVSVGTTGQFVDKNAGQNKVVTASSSLVGLDAGNYELTTNGQVTANISKKQITGVLTAQDKVYDGTTSALVNGSLNGLIAGDQVNLNAQGQFADKNAASNKTVNVSGNLSGTDAGNYDLAANTSAQANISKKQITGSITAQDKVYDGTTSAIVNGSLNGLITGDQVNLNAQGQFADKNAGSNKNVNVSGNLTGTDAGNYSLQANSQTQANIAKAKAQVIGNSLTTTYNGQQQHVTGFTAQGLVNGERAEVLTNVTATGASATSTGNYQNQVSGHDQNYDLTFTAGMLKIEAPLVDPKPPIVPEKPSQPDLSIWQDLLGNPYQRAIHFAPQANKPKQSDNIEIEIIGDGINMDGIHTLTGNF